MTKCPHCGKLVDQHEKYCNHCEADLWEFQEEKQKPGKSSHGHH